ncbi:Myb-like DNA-binding domain-containing protein [Colletotrichum higginsianum IMI 349063]|uniref:Myb-like DNA-binding domain-containing protein n=3 Tax=Colletotrichum higginsianum TaxID=80884 RepID=A0A1B7Y2H5_COLHI|nr:Myb-like DNA-binding domain-containing protein [Colletotrichum higginsianum IMI 349063]OBR06208.1 Myb-like DNA-binding domain-containing protein [Colletotrichum higginsianum IMI 349063]TIC97638.1 Telomeric DNA-binding factor trf1 [Colletotrichum higginsianum]GJD01555.1 MYB-like DNA-binding domain-containing protein [Colletotrichum higginsianum]
MLMEGIEAIAESAQAAKAEAHSPTEGVEGPEMKQESPTAVADLGETPQFPLKRPRDPSPDDPDAESKRLKVDEEAPSLDLGFDMDAMIQGVMMDISNEMGKVDGLDAVTDVDMTAEALASVSQDSSHSAEPHAVVLSEPLALMRRITTSCLSNFAMQLLVIMSQHVYDDVYRQLQDKDTDIYKSYSTLKTLFCKTRSMYSTTDLILDPAVLDLTAPDNLTDIQVANLASFCCELFTFDGNHELASQQLLALRDHFFSIFLSGGESISHEISELFVAVKTQLVIESVTTADQSAPVDQLIAEAFFSDLEDKLRARHDGTELTPEERALVTTVEERKSGLIAYASGLPDTVLLKIGYPEEDLFRLLNAHLRQKLQSFSGLASRHGIDLPPIMTNGDLDSSMPPDLDDLGISSLLEATDGLVAQYLPSDPVESLPSEQPPVPTTETSLPPAEPATTAAPESTPSAAPATNGTTNETQDTNDILALVAQSTQEYVRTTLNNLSPAPYQPTVPTPTGAAPVTQTTYLSHLQQTQQQSPYYGYPPPVEQPPPPASHDSNEKLPPSQSLPSAVLYDRARQAALSKTNNQQRREGTTSTRRPWTQEEEKALMTGLDMVQGPHWSQILSLFGAEGTLSNILKDRTQVQLKDKARNLKLFFLKTNSEMPYYLQAVTGELKTRAPTQAARKEAEERARMNSEEEQARVQGIMTLAGGLQHPQQSRPSVVPPTAPSTPLQSAAQMSHHMAAHATTPTHAAAPGPPATPVAATPTHARVPHASSPYAATAAQLSQTPHHALSQAQSQPQTPTHSHIHQHHSHPGTPQPQQHQHQNQHQHQHQHQHQQPPQQPQPEHVQPQVSQAAEPAPQYSTDSSAPVYSQENEDLKEAALMQSLRELEAYSGGSTSLS